MSELTFDQQLGQHIHALRMEEGWTLRELGRRANVAPSYLLRIERGESSVSIGVACRIGAAFNRDIVNLLRVVTEDGVVKP